MFLNPIWSTLYFLILNSNFQISSLYDNLSKSICVVSFDNSLTSSSTSSANSSIRDHLWVYIVYSLYWHFDMLNQLTNVQYNLW